MTVPTTNRRRSGRREHEDGVALISVLLLLMLITALGAALAVSGQTETLIARNHQTAAEAEAAAEAGLNHAIALTLENLQGWSGNIDPSAGAPFASVSAAMSSLLRGPDNTTGTTATDADNGSLEALGGAPALPRFPTRVTLAPGIQYDARLFDDDAPRPGVTLFDPDRTRIGETNPATEVSDANMRIVVRASGYAPGNTTATVEATIGPLKLPAIVTNGNLRISGSARILGTEGSVHSNADLTVGGNAFVQHHATSSGDYDVSGTPSIGGNSGGAKSLVPVPPIRASDHLSKADYILNNDGTMTTVSSGMTAACDPCAGAWTYTPPTWTLSTAPTDGTYYVEGGVQISGSPGLGSSGSPAIVSIIAEQSIDISGDIYLQPDTLGLLFVTDQDLKINGNLHANYQAALMLVHEQVDISGASEITGQLLVEDAAMVSATAAENGITGSLDLTYNGGLESNFLFVTGWRRLR
jgi:hypothetical protein